MISGRQPHSQRLPKLVTIVITGHPADAIESRIARGEVFSILEKPFTPDAVCDAVRRAIA